MQESESLANLGWHAASSLAGLESFGTLSLRLCNRLTKHPQPPKIRLTQNMAHAISSEAAPAKHEDGGDGAEMAPRKGLQDKTAAYDQRGAGS